MAENGQLFRFLRKSPPESVADITPEALAYLFSIPPVSRPAFSMASDSDTPVVALKNIGPASASLLQEIGVKTRADIERLRPALVYRILAHRFNGVSLLMLYALDAAVRDVHWLSLSEEDKTRLRREAEQVVIAD
jgi:DNA transformation protein